MSFDFKPPVVASASHKVAKFDDETLQRFARLIVKDPTNRNTHALTVCNGDVHRSFDLLRATENNEFTSLVVAVRETIVEESPEDQHLTKDEFVQQLQTFIGNASVEKVKLDAMRLMAELRGFLKKEPETSNVVNVVQNVMVVPASAEGSDWTAKAKSRQQKLIDEARTIDV